MTNSGNLEVDELGIKILRNGIMTEHIDYSQIEHAEIKKEFRIKNWIITLAIGVLLIIISGLWLIDFISDFEYNPQNYTEMLMMKDTKDWTDEEFSRFYKFAINNMPPSSMSEDEELRQFKKIYRWWK